MEYIKLGIRQSSYSSGPVHLSFHDRALHMLISGKSGTGKSTLLANIISQELSSSRGLLLIDPHGELAEQALNCIPPTQSRMNKTIYINPSDLDWPIGFNVFDRVPPEKRSVRAVEIVAAFKAVWHASWGARMDYILLNTVRALLDYPGTTLLGIPQMLRNQAYREKVRKHIHDPVIAAFWREEWPAIEKELGIEAIAPILNKIGAVLSSPEVRNIVAQKYSAFSPRYVMDNGFIVIANLSQIGADHAALLAAILVSSFSNAAMSRSDFPADQRRGFSLFVDEFGSYTSLAFTGTLSQARKFQLAVTLAHQYLKQIVPEVLSSIFGNCANLICFKIGPEDAGVMAEQLHPYPPETLMETDNYKAYCRINQNGSQSDTFLLVTHPPPKPFRQEPSKIIQHARRWATKREKVEERIARFLAADKDETKW